MDVTAAALLLLSVPAFAQTGKSEACDTFAPFPSTWTYAVLDAQAFAACDGAPHADIYWRWCAPVVSGQDYAVLLNGGPLPVTVTHDPAPSQRTGLYHFTTSSFRPVIKACDSFRVQVVQQPAKPQVKATKARAWR